MTAPDALWPQNAALLLRLIYKRAKALGPLPELLPRALQDVEIEAGRSEFAVVDSRELDGAGWDGTFLVLPRTYTGYIAVHYAADVDQRETLPDEARLTTALATFTEDPRAQAIPGLRQFGTVPARWFLNDRPVKLERPLVLTLELEWSLDVDLLIPREFLTPGGSPP
ncbi:hypothetical protein [Deinococcus budaensis]|uniref:Uncharacterized protein n=1 Tax=Deinococcus budaensis TaxID=1665626 RepID=A0A7W8LQC3_9DEIO|nr:hypothetical protein [Deinococcus budaensis]MBB5234472.1 hypothetical protein [Deinococcus budaensis]